MLYVVCCMLYDVCVYACGTYAYQAKIYVDTEPLHDELAPDERACQVSETSPLPLTPHPSIYYRILDNVKYTFSQFQVGPGHQQPLRGVRQRRRSPQVRLLQRIVALRADVPQGVAASHVGK